MATLKNTPFTAATIKRQIFGPLTSARQSASLVAIWPKKKLKIIKIERIKMDSPDAKTIKPDANFAFIPLCNLAINNYNARRFTENMTQQRQARFDELVISVKGKGVIEPLLVRPIEGGFEIIAGERRYRAACQAAEELGIEQYEYELPCMVREISEDDAFDLMLIENLQRDDLTPFETAQAFRTYLERHGNAGESVTELSMRTGIPPHAIRRQVRILDLPDEALSAWKDGKITQSHAEMFTRLDDRTQILDLLTACIRLKLSTRELAERIGTISPDLDRAFFDKEECQICHFNGAVQSGLFADSAQGGKCGNAQCYEAKQGNFFTENWIKSKAAEAYGTRGYRFGHRLGQDRCEAIVFENAATRCLDCDRFVSILRLNGTVVGGYARSCTGPVACFEELYREAAAAPKEKETKAAETETKEPGPETKQGKSETPAAAKQILEQHGKKKAPSKNSPLEETGPVFNGPRGERYRESFFQDVLWEKINACAPNNNQVRRLIILSLALASSASRELIGIKEGIATDCKSDDFAKKIFDDLPEEHLHETLRSAAVKHILHHSVSPAVRRIVADNFGISLVQEWTLTKEYLESLNKSEIVRIGEESSVGIWKDEKTQAYRKKHFRGKALLSLKKEHLIDIIMKSGMQLKGRVPAEVLGK